MRREAGDATGQLIRDLNCYRKSLLPSGLWHSCQVDRQAEGLYDSTVGRNERFLITGTKPVCPMNQFGRFIFIER
ncbi:MAG: hypothetical protein D6753_17460 [Planctomycetota bacterium]|nr:MAG: hypothetical protein D6753_17460 [Planctomycetota bacterium]